MNWRSVHTRLRDTLSSIYLDKDSSVRVAVETGIDPRHVEFSDIAADNWFEIIQKADIAGMLIPLVERALGEHKTNETLKELLETLKAEAGSMGQDLNPGDIVQEIEAINLPRVQEEGGYQIDEPPANWITEEMTLDELGSRSLRISLDESRQVLNVFQSDKRNILRISFQSSLKIEYDPGISKVNSRWPILILSDVIPVAQLTIMPLERNSAPPAFIKQSLEHNFMIQVSGIMQVANLKSIITSMTKNKRLRLTAEFDQKLENVIIDGRPDQSLVVNQTLIGIQGFVRDYLLALSYVSQATSNKAEIESNVALLKRLVDSFKLIKPSNLDEEERRLKEAGDKRYIQWIAINAKQSLGSQFNLLIKQWRELDCDKSESKKQVIEDIKRFKETITVFVPEDLYADFTGQILMDQHDLLIADWRELDWEKEESRKLVIREANGFLKAIEAFADDKRLHEITGLLIEFMQKIMRKSLEEMKSFFISEGQQET